MTGLRAARLARTIAAVVLALVGGFLLACANSGVTMFGGVQ